MRNWIRRSVVTAACTGLGFGLWACGSSTGNGFADGAIPDAGFRLSEAGGETGGRIPDAGHDATLPDATTSLDAPLAHEAAINETSTSPEGSSLEAAADHAVSDAPAGHEAGDGAPEASGDGPTSSDAKSIGEAGTEAGPGDVTSDGKSVDTGTTAEASSSGDSALDGVADTAVDSGPPSFITSCSGGHTVVTGTVYAPNGIDPIPRVRVYAAESINPYPTNYCDKCSAPIDPSYSQTTSAVDGTFSLNLDFVTAAASIDFAIQIGRFRKHTTLPITPCTTAAVPVADATIPGNSSQGDIPKIVVSAGEADHLDAVLATLGITEYDCYEGRKVAGSSSSTCALQPTLNIADVLSSETDLGAYNMAFLSCAPGAYAEYITNHDQATMTTNTQNWVAGGGRIFVTDTAYDYIAQAFPGNITWAGASGTPQPVDSANIGCAPGGTTAHSTLYPATIDDASLASWLTLLGAASGTPTVASIQGYYQPWSTIKSLPSASTLIADGTMPIDPTYSTTKCATPTMTDVPLTTEFDVPSCGRVVFSSFHTYTGTGASVKAANEKIMEYLIFAAATCSG